MCGVTARLAEGLLVSQRIPAPWSYLCSYYISEPLAYLALPTLITKSFHGSALGCLPMPKLIVNIYHVKLLAIPTLIANICHCYLLTYLAMPVLITMITVLIMLRLECIEGFPIQEGA
jgi:hypothetical protein